MKTFPSKVDPWVVVVLLVAVLATVGAVAQATVRATGLALVGPAVLALIGVALPQHQQHANQTQPS